MTATASRWTHLPISIAHHATRDEEASAGESIALGAWLPVSSGWDGFPVEGFVHPDVLGCIEDRIAEADREFAAANGRANDAERALDALLRDVSEAIRVLADPDADDAEGMDAAMQRALAILEDRR